MIRFLQTILIAYGFGIALVANANGVEDATGKGSTEADACKYALTMAESNALRRGAISITEKRCECREDSEAAFDTFRWSCIGFVSWTKE